MSSIAKIEPVGLRSWRMARALEDGEDSFRSDLHVSPGARSVSSR